MYSPTGNPAELVNEEIVRPLLTINTAAEAAAAICVFFLVWIWTHRGGRPTLSRRTGWQAWFLPQRKLVPWRITPPSRINGLILFPLATWAFFHAVIIAEIPVPGAPPTVAFDGRPILTKSTSGTVSAIISATISGEGTDAQWYVEWGLTAQYNNQTSAQYAADGSATATLTNLPAARTIHYRITARNLRNVTHTDNVTFNTSDIIAPAPPPCIYGAVWLSWAQWLGIALLFVAMAGSLRALPPEHRGWAAGLIAALLVWFNPAILINGHIWPQWDTWVLPPFLLAALLATLDWWLVVGLVLGVGVMFKGQTAIAGPILLIWPLLAGRLGAFARIVGGFALSSALVLSPWLVLNNSPPEWSAGPLRWIQCVMAACVVAAALSFYRRPFLQRAKIVSQELHAEWHGIPKPTATPHTSLFDLFLFCVSLLIGIICITLLLLGRWPSDSELPRMASLLLVLAVLLPPWLLPRRALFAWLACILAASLWASAYLYHGDWSWKTVGFEYGTVKFPVMNYGVGGLPGILARDFGTNLHDPAMTLHLPGGTIFTPDIRQFCMGIFALLMLLSGIGAAIQSRRNHPRLLAALTCIWVLMPSILCQMNERYPLWGAVISATLIAISPGLTLLHIVLSLIAAGLVGEFVLRSDPSRSPQVFGLMQRWTPDHGWIVLTIGAIFLYIALSPGRRPAPEELEIGHG